MRLNPAPFEAMRSGRKTIEIRLNDEKRKQIKTGDAIIFTRTDGAEQIIVEVLARHECATFRDLYEKFAPAVCGSEYNNIEERLADTYRNYYTREQEAESGVLGIEIRLKQ